MKEINLEMSEKGLELLKYCLFLENETLTGSIKGTGFKFDMGFHPLRLNEKSDEIEALFTPIQDIETGVEFVNMCELKNGGFCPIDASLLDALICLGQAAKVIYLCDPRETWDDLIKSDKSPRFALLSSHVTELPDEELNCK